MLSVGYQGNAINGVQVRPAASANSFTRQLSNSGDFPRVPVTMATLKPMALPRSSASLLYISNSYDEKTSRLASFGTWPAQAKANPAALAEAGFYYTGGGSGDTVTCYSCKVKIGDWTYDMTPMSEHRKRSPGCEYVRRHSHAPDASAMYLGIPEAAPPRLVTNYGVDPTEDLSVESNRLLTFTTRPGWPENCPVKPEDCARAGFYYTGDRDKVQCHACRGRLLNWAPGDSAFGEHMRHFPRCSFLEKLAREAEEREREEELSRRAARISLSEAETRTNSFQRQGDSGFGMGRIDEWLKLPVVEIVRNLGVSEQFLRLALEELSQKGVKELQTGSILDIVFRLEDEQKKQDVQDEEMMLVESDSNTEQNDAGPMDMVTMETNLVIDEKSRLAAESRPKSSSPPPINPAYIRIQEENQRLKKSTRCRRCEERAANVLLLPCRHLGSCDKCANEVNNCPLCNQQVLGTVKTFMS